MKGYDRYLWNLEIRSTELSIVWIGSTSIPGHQSCEITSCPVKRLPNVHLTAMLFFLSQLMTNPDTPRNWPRVGNPTRGTGRYLPVQMETWEIFLGVGRRQGKSPVTHS